MDIKQALDIIRQELDTQRGLDAADEIEGIWRELGNWTTIDFTPVSTTAEPHVLISPEKLRRYEAAVAERDKLRDEKEKLIREILAMDRERTKQYGQLLERVWTIEHTQQLADHFGYDLVKRPEVESKGEAIAKAMKL